MRLTPTSALVGSFRGRAATEFAESERPRPVHVRAAADREALGLGAFVGPVGDLRGQAPLRPRGPGAQPPVSQPERRVLVRLRGACRARDERSAAGYRLYGLRELNQLRSLRDLRRRFGLELSDVAFAARLRREPALRAAVESWLAGIDLAALEWEQRKHEALLAA